MADSHLKVIEGGNTPSTTPGTESWSEDIRKSAKSLAGNLDEGYMEMARILYQVYDTPVDGVPNNPPVYTKWGYASWKDYVQEELGIHYKKAQRLRRIWYNLEVALRDKLDVDLKKRIVALGMSKTRELVGVLTPKNAEKWVEKAEELSYPKLCVAIRKFNEEKEKRQEAVAAQPPEELKAASEAGFGPESGEGGGGGGSSDGLPLAVDSVIGAPLDDETPVPNITADSYRQMQFQLPIEQHVIVKQALELAEKLTTGEHTSTKSTLLHLICLDFLASNGDGKSTKQQKLRKLTQIAEAFGLKLIVVEDNEVIFGLETLENLAKAE